MTSRPSGASATCASDFSRFLLTANSDITPWSPYPKQPVRDYPIDVFAFVVAQLGKLPGLLYICGTFRKMTIQRGGFHGGQVDKRSSHRIGDAQRALRQRRTGTTQRTRSFIQM